MNGLEWYAGLSFLVCWRYVLNKVYSNWYLWVCKAFSRQLYACGYAIMLVQWYVGGLFLSLGASLLLGVVGFICYLSNFLVV